MRLSLGNAFRPGLWPTLAMLVLCALFLRLSWWQWQRGEYKRELLASYAEQAKRPPVSLDALLADPTLESFPAYLKVSATGSYDNARQVLLQDIPRDEGVGYEVLTPFLMQGHVIALVDRGWVPADAQGRAPDVAVSTAPRRIEASIGTLPVPGIKLGTPAPPAAGWPKLMFYPDSHALLALYGPKLMTPVLKLDPAQPDGYARQAVLDVGLTPARHLGYAFQWLMLALAVFTVWLVVNLRRTRRRA
ncbi:MAG TPA: SURF1 family protein [Gammaproteobacteria bacterium]|nr:SURF1 family protein [Gammaproteobacteria bacterium]